MYCNFEVTAVLSKIVELQIIFNPLDFFSSKFDCFHNVVQLHKLKGGFFFLIAHN